MQSRSSVNNPGERHSADWGLCLMCSSGSSSLEVIPGNVLRLWSQLRLTKGAVPCPHQQCHTLTHMCQASRARNSSRNTRLDLGRVSGVRADWEFFSWNWENW